MNDLAAYFAAQKPAPPRHRTSAENAKQGPELATKFHCTQCHGQRLLGQQQMPRLAGQQYDYLRAQLRGFRDGKRGDLDGKMSESAQGLSDKDIDALSDYIAGLGG
jgi:cytochrome c553